MIPPYASQPGFTPSQTSSAPAPPGSAQRSAIATSIVLVPSRTSFVISNSAGTYGSVVPASVLLTNTRPWKFTASKCAMTRCACPGFGITKLRLSW